MTIIISFSIGPPSNFPIGAENIVTTPGPETDNISNLSGSTEGIFLGPSRPPRKPPPVATELSSVAIDAAHAALRSFILDANVSAGSAPTRMSLFEAHWCLGHSNYDSILAWEKSGTLLIDGVVLSDHKRIWCERCKGANLKRHSSPSVSAHRPAEVMHTISWDVFGRTRIVGVGNTWYFNVGRDRATGFGWTQPMTYKSQASPHCIAVIKFEQKQTGMHMKVFQCDGGGEYAGPLLKQFLFEDNGTFMRVSAPYHSNDNGGVERLIGILAALTRVLMAGSPLPDRYFPYAWIYGLLIRNVLRCASVPAGLSPYILMRGRRLNLKWFRPFGMKAYVLIGPRYEAEHKLSDRQAALCYFVGLDEFNQCYLFIHGTTQRLIRSAYATFMPTDPALLNTTAFDPRDSWLPDLDADPVAALHEPRVDGEDQDEGLLDELPWAVHRSLRSTPTLRDAGPEPTVRRVARVRSPAPPLAPVFIPEAPTAVVPSRLRLAPAPTSRVAREQLFDAATVTDGLRRSTRERTLVSPFNIASVTGQTYAMPLGSVSAVLAPDVDALIEHGAVYHDQTDTVSVLSCLHPTLDLGYMCAARAVASNGARGVIPRTFKAAATSSNSFKWLAAIEVEFANHERNGTFVECYVAPSAWLLGSMWIFDVKHDGRHKARLVALGNQLKEQAGDPERSSPTAGQIEFRTVVAICTEMEWKLFSYDVTAAYLYGKVPTDVKIFMRLPPGYKTKLPSRAGFVIALRLVKGLYGLTFAGRLWHDDFAAFLLHDDQGYSRDISAPCIFYILEPVGHRQLLVLFVDDFTLGLEDETDRIEFERKVLLKYKITGGELVSRFVGIEVARTLAHTTLTQTAYILSKVEEFEQYLTGSNPLTPAIESVQLSKLMCPVPGSAEATHMATLPYRALVGSVLFAAISTRPDINKAVLDLTRFLNNPGRQHWKAALHVLLYLRGTSALGIRFTASGRRDISRLQLMAQVDASFAPDWQENEARSITGYFLRLAHGSIYWESHRQPTPAQSTGESEYAALAACCATIIWVVHFLVAIGFPQGTVSVYEDSTTAISMATRPLLSRKTKHITVKVEWLRAMVALGVIMLIECPTASQIADGLTKIQGKTLFLAQRPFALGYALWIPPTPRPDLRRFDNARGGAPDDADAGGVEETKHGR